MTLYFKVRNKYIFLIQLCVLCFNNHSLPGSQIRSTPWEVFGLTWGGGESKHHHALVALCTLITMSISPAQAGFDQMKITLLQAFLYAISAEPWGKAVIQWALSKSKEHRTGWRGNTLDHVEVSLLYSCNLCELPLPGDRTICNISMNENIDLCIHSVGSW